MEASRLCISATNFGVIVMQAFVFVLQIGRLNEKLGALFSTAISILWLLLSARPDSLFAVLTASDVLILITNSLLLAYFQWVVLQNCIHLNAATFVKLSENVSCYDWWHFGKYFGCLSQ